MYNNWNLNLLNLTEIIKFSCQENSSGNYVACNCFFENDKC